ncbi:MAG: hypothetical protein R6U98_12005 [Pirellulaceae bacterium]
MEKSTLNLKRHPQHAAPGYVGSAEQLIRWRFDPRTAFSEILLHVRYIGVIFSSVWADASWTALPLAFVQDGTDENELHWRTERVTMTHNTVMAIWGALFCTCTWTLAAEGPAWLDDYGQAMDEAKEHNRNMLVYFCEEGLAKAEDELCRKFASSSTLHPYLENYVLTRIPMSERARVGGKDIQLSKHEAFSELRGKNGMAVIEFEDPDSEYHGRVVSIYPLSLPGALTTKHLKALLDLPKGSLTQRTLVLAVRIHPDGPSSTDGTFLTTLAEESESHASHQARINTQGHHNWNSRFHRISRRLPDGLLAQEVCAESWPGKGLIRAALDVVGSWRESSGHWRAVRGRHRYYGYDMKRGRNGIWYATGIFGTR